MCVAMVTGLLHGIGLVHIRTIHTDRKLTSLWTTQQFIDKNVNQMQLTPAAETSLDRAGLAGLPA